MERNNIPIDRLREMLSYDPATGVLTWLKGAGRQRAGSVAGTVSHRGYLRVQLDGIETYAHRIAWALVTGEWIDEIDHVNGASNRFRNLRPASRQENQRNVRKHKDNRSGEKGVSWDCRKQKWRARIHLSGKEKFLGYFDARREAKAAYDAKAKELFGEFARAA
jgi:hypothetical protein